LKRTLERELKVLETVLVEGLATVLQTVSSAKTVKGLSCCELA